MPDAKPMTGADRRYLRRLAHDLNPVVQVGGAGLSPAVVAAIDQALEDHELVKLRIAHERDERRRIAARVAEQTGSELAGLVGHVAILYRAAADIDKRQIELPSQSRGA